jgi:undecaprenyl-phosphate 4-deoxy-4-formamido-L-arabinose transferase
MRMLSFVIPCWRSEATLPAVVDELVSLVSGHAEYDYEIILVDDASTDGTADTILTLCKKYGSSAKGLCLSKNFGQHGAVMAGFSEAKGDLVFCLDDDGESPIDCIFQMIGKIDEGYDAVFARFTDDKRKAARRLGTRIRESLNQIILGKPKDIAFNSFFVLRKYVVDEMLRYGGPYPYLGGLIYRTTTRVANVDMQRRSRIAGESSYTMRKLVRILLNEFTSFSVKPLRVAAVIGIISAITGFVFILVIVIQKLLHPTIAAGWSSTIALLLLIGGIQMMILGLIGEYIGRIFISLNKMPQFVIREKFGFRNDSDE